MSAGSFSVASRLSDGRQHVVLSVCGDDGKETDLTLSSEGAERLEKEVRDRRKGDKQLSFESRVKVSIFDALSKNYRTQLGQEPRSEDGPGSPMPRHEPEPLPDARASDA